MPERRILSIWFPRLGAERLLRRTGMDDALPFAVVRDTGQMQVLCSLSQAAEQAGLRVGQPLRDAHAMCASLVTKLQNPHQEAGFLTALGRWAERLSPWVSTQPPDALLLDITGCAHLFGGEEAMVRQVIEEASLLGLTTRCGLAGTVGAAWALARYAGAVAVSNRNGDAIDQEARATRSRAAKRRHWERGGAAPVSGVTRCEKTPFSIAPPGQARRILSPLPIAALRLEEEQIAALNRLGLRKIGDLLNQPRGPLARRFGRGLLMRMDQAVGAAPEPVSPARVKPLLATRLTLPEPIGLIEDLQAGLDRLVPRLCQLLADQGQGARKVRLEAWRADGTMGWIEAGLARASDVPDRIRPLLAMRLEEIDAGFGIDTLRLIAAVTEPIQHRTAAGHLDATQAARARLERDTGVEDLMGRLGGRIGMDAITRLHPVSSHIPEKTVQILAAAWSEPAGDWPRPATPRPLLMWPPEPVNAPDAPQLSGTFRWRGRVHDLAEAKGPERIAPEWWLDDPNWRSGVRDYWQVITGRGERLWLYYAHGGTMSSGWFCQGRFA